MFFEAAARLRAGRRGWETCLCPLAARSPAGLQRIADFLVFGKAVGLVLGIDLLAVHRDFEASAGGGLQVQGLNLVLEFLEQFLRQTDGMRLVISGGAVFNRNDHAFLRGTSG